MFWSNHIIYDYICPLISICTYHASYLSPSTYPSSNLSSPTLNRSCDLGDLYDLDCNMP